MIDHFESGITLTITTCKRLNYYSKTIDKFFKNCLDANKISRIIVHDDNSSEEDRDIMLKNNPHFEFNWLNCGHANSLNILFNSIRTEYFFHLEDDWILLNNIKLFDMCLSVLYEGIDSYICGLNIGRDAKNLANKNYPNIKYYIHKYVQDGRFSSDYNTGDTSWPGFRLAPGLHRTRAIQSIKYDSVPQHERHYALKYQKAGYKVAFNASDPIFSHIGITSAYNITKAPR